MADIEIIQKLRDLTGAGVMSCKKKLSRKQAATLKKPLPLLKNGVG